MIVQEKTKPLRKKRERQVDLQMFSFSLSPSLCTLFVSVVLLQDNGSAKYFQGTRTGINMGEKVAQVNISFSSVFLFLLKNKLE